jgi:hypothetical protein
MAGRPGDSTYPLFVSFDLVWFFLRFGVGILHSMEKATQLVQGTPKLAASQRTCSRRFMVSNVHLQISAMTAEDKLTFRAWQVYSTHEKSNS